MAMTLTRARRRGLELQFEVWLDNAIALADGSPDPNWLVRYNMFWNPQPGETQTQTLARIKATVRAMAQAELAGRQSVVEQVLAGEGQVL